MGVFGLRKFIDASACTKFLPVAGEAESCGDCDHTAETAGEFLSSSSAAAAPQVDHVLVDMNCIIHGCFGGDLTAATGRGVFEAVLQRLKVLLTRVVVPCVSLTLCIDGPAPYAKLNTQRQRRRRLALLDTSGASQLTSLAVTPGSLFLVELENALAAHFKSHGGCGFLPHYVPVFLHGSTVEGEGEAKIARALAHIATAPLPQRRRYNPNDTVVVIGNDIDLALTCLGATQYHNFFVLGPSSMQLISISDILYRWLCSGAQGACEFLLSPQELASVRVDFVFLFLLNGGDHYVGAGEVAHILWKRYRTVRGASMHRSIVAPNLMSLDVNFLAEILQTADYTGDCDVRVGVELLHAALWSLYTTVTGMCPDYQYVPAPTSPHLNNVRAAVADCQKKHRGIKIHTRYPTNEPLTPLETFVALMPTEAALPSGVALTLRSSPKYEPVARQLLSSNDAQAVAMAAKQAVSAAEGHLTVSERYLQKFTTPVQLNVRQRPRRLSRYEQHRMLATKGRIEREDPPPLVECVAMPETFYYVNVAYPPYVKNLFFPSPFDQPAGATSTLGGSGAFTTTESGAARPSALRGDVCGRSNSKARRIPLCVEEGAKTPVTAQLQQTLQKASALRMPEGRDKKTLRRLRKRLNTQRQLIAKEMRNDENTAEARRHVLRHDDKTFLDELQRFLGVDGGGVAQFLRRSGERPKKEKETEY